MYVLQEIVFRVLDICLPLVCSFALYLIVVFIIQIEAYWDCRCRIIKLWGGGTHSELAFSGISNFCISDSWFLLFFAGFWLFPGYFLETWKYKNYIQLSKQIIR